MSKFQQEYSRMKKNPPKGVPSGSWVECVSASRTTTKGKKYQVRNYFNYLNTYGSGKDKYCYWDEFITLKNDEGYTVKMNLIRFNPCEAKSETKRKKAEQIVKEIEQGIKDGTVILATADGEIITNLNKLR